MCVALHLRCVCVCVCHSWQLFSTPGLATFVFNEWLDNTFRERDIYIDVFVLTIFGGLTFLGHDESLGFLGICVRCAV